MTCRHERRSTLALLRTLPRDARTKEGEPATRQGGGWSFALSLNMYGMKAPDGSDLWHLSAKLQPNGRSSTPEDWTFLGQALSLLGAPADYVPKTIETSPNAVHHWEWSASGMHNDSIRQRNEKVVDLIHPERRSN